MTFHRCSLRPPHSSRIICTRDHGYCDPRRKPQYSRFFLPTDPRDSQTSRVRGCRSRSLPGMRRWICRLRRRSIFSHFPGSCFRDHSPGWQPGRPSRVCCEGCPGRSRAKIGMILLKIGLRSHQMSRGVSLLAIVLEECDTYLAISGCWSTSALWCTGERAGSESPWCV